MNDKDRRTFREGEGDTRAREAALAEAARLLRDEATTLGEAQAMPDDGENSAPTMACMTLVHALALHICWMCSLPQDTERLEAGILLAARQLAATTRHYYDHPELWSDDE